LLSSKSLKGLTKPIPFVTFSRKKV